MLNGGGPLSAPPLPASSAHATSRAHQPPSPSGAMSEKVVTRFAPSPTGFLHIGGARTALFSYLYARKHGGKFLVRLEETARERRTQEAVDAIFEGMAWLGLPGDNAQPIYQTQRFPRYAEVIQQMLKAG